MTDQQTGMDWAPPPLGGDHDFIPTPQSVTWALLQEFPPPDGLVGDPFAGGGAILQELRAAGWDDLWANEVRPEEGEALIQLLGPDRVAIGDWFRRDRLALNGEAHGSESCSIVTNPPFGRLPEATLSLFEITSRPRPYIAVLMPIEEISGVARAKRYPVPTGMVTLSWRPFSCVRGVAWYVYEAGKPPLDIRVR